MATTPPSITAAPTPPDRADRATFSARATASFDHLKNNAIPEISAVATNVYNNAVEAVTQAGIATTKAGEASTSASNAATQATNAANSATLATTNGAAQVTLAAAQVTLATTQATNAGNSATAAETSATNAANQVTLATTQAGIATTKAGEAAASATAAANSAASISSGPVTSVNGMTGVVTGLQSALVSGTNIKTINGGSLLGGGNLAIVGSLIRSARTSNTILGVSDNSKLIDITSGTFTQTFDAAATLGDGWFCYIQNSGTGDITLDPNASETIDGLTSYVMYPGEVRLVQCAGSALRSIVINAFSRVYTASGTFTKPPGYVSFGVDLISGGGGGAAGSSTQMASSGGGGGGGGRALRLISATSVGATESVTVGAGGSGGASANASGTFGGNTEFCGYVVYGGANGVVGVQTNSSAGLGGGGGGVGCPAETPASRTTVSYGAGNRAQSYPFDIGQEGGGIANDSGTTPTTGIGNANSCAIYGGGGGGCPPLDAGTNKNGGVDSFYGGGGGGGGGSSGTRGGASGVSIYGVCNGVVAVNGANANNGADATNKRMCGGGGGGGSSGSPAGFKGGNGGLPAGGGGGGGGGTSTAGLGGNGARGELRIWGVI